MNGKECNPVLLSGRKVALMSDIHSNYHAFKACVEDALRCDVDSFLFLGDYVSDLAEPARTMDLVYEIQSRYPTVCLRGNREGYMLDRERGDTRFEQGSKSGSLLFTYDHLRSKDLDFFRELKISDAILVGGIPMEIAHASIENDRYYFDSNDGRTAEIFPKMQSNYLLTGHSHKQYIKREGNKTIINPGSVGIPHGASPIPKYAVLEIENGDVSCKLREVPYSIADVIHSQFASGLVTHAQYWAIGVLYDIVTGEECVMNLLKHVLDAGDVYDESVWRSSAEKLGMKFTEREILDWYYMGKE